VAVLKTQEVSATPGRCPRPARELCHLVPIFSYTDPVSPPHERQTLISRSSPVARAPYASAPRAC